MSKGRLLRLWQKPSAERHLDSELQFHVEQQIADYIAAGMSPQEACRRARARLGATSLILTTLNEANGGIVFKISEDGLALSAAMRLLALCICEFNFRSPLIGLKQGPTCMNRSSNCQLAALPLGPAFPANRNQLDRVRDRRDVTNLAAPALCDSLRLFVLALCFEVFDERTLLSSPATILVSFPRGRPRGSG